MMVKELIDSSFKQYPAKLTPLIATSGKGIKKR
jgi:hypothetical protein